MSKVDREYKDISRRVQGLIDEASDFGRTLTKEENRDVVIWLGWKAAEDMLAEKMVKDIQVGTSKSGAFTKLAAAFRNFASPVSKESDHIVQAVRAKVIENFKNKHRPPKAALEASNIAYAHALKGEKIRSLTVKGW